MLHKDQKVNRRLSGMGSADVYLSRSLRLSDRLRHVSLIIEARFRRFDGLRGTRISKDPGLSML